MTRAAVITVSDRSARGLREDTSGPLLAELLGPWVTTVDPVVVVADDVAAVTAAVRAALSAGADLVVTTGGTGIGPRDVTPEAVGPLLERALPGVAEAIRARGTAATPTAALSRGVAGVVGRSLVVTLPGSAGGVRDGVSVLGPLVAHVLEQLAGGDHARVSVRLFAAAAAAAGMPVTTSEATTLAALRDELAALGDEVGRVLARCSWLVDGVAVARGGDAPLPPGSTVDVLPPYAGG